MPFGSTHWVLRDKGFQRVLVRTLGVEDLHSHIRWKAVKRLINFDAPRTLEVGANTGVMTFAVASRNPRGTVVASEYDNELLAQAENVAMRCRIGNVSFRQEDARQLVAAEEPFDQVLAIDVLEHIDDDTGAVRQLAGALRPGGQIIVSVPTPEYPAVFGRPYHESIGHVRDGYRAADMAALLETAGLQVVEHFYYTGPIASRACSVYYRSSLSGRSKAALFPFLLAVGMLGERVPPRPDRAASLAMLAAKPDQGY